MCLSSKGVEDTCEFYGNVTSTDDNDSFWLMFKLEETIGGDAKVSSGNFFLRGDDRVTTNRDADVIGVDSNGVPFSVRFRDLDLGGGKNSGMTSDEVDVLPFPVSEVDTTELLYVSIALTLEGIPVEVWFFYACELVPFGLTKLVRKICGVPHQLFWDAS